MSNNKTVLQGREKTEFMAEWNRAVAKLTGNPVRKKVSKEQFRAAKLGRTYVEWLMETKGMTREDAVEFEAEENRAIKEKEAELAAKRAEEKAEQERTMPRKAIDHSANSGRTLR